MVSSTRTKSTARKAPHASRLYREFAPAYDAVWPMLAKRRILTAIRSLKLKPGDRVLEVGIGTGMSLLAYPREIELTGVDLSESMLAQAQKQINDGRMTNFHVLPMNAEELKFPDASFDVVTSFHVISVVSDPRRMMLEMLRVCKPGGRILLINHFRSNNPWIARMVDSAGAVTRRLGWRTDLSLQEIVAEMPLKVERRYKTSPTSLFTIMTATKLDLPAGQPALVGSK
ncbi:MAG: methyltransferase domain-containing protein [Planctomycetaceae bacterium]|nr:MAG: methyltransferase domain-containing protein [Planctomycetaceae bacterium]